MVGGEEKRATIHIPLAVFMIFVLFRRSNFALFSCHLPARKFPYQVSTFSMESADLLFTPLLGSQKKNSRH
jgi:hypothetical protein